MIRGRVVPFRLSLSDGVQTRVVDTGGGGVPVVLVHGLANSLEIWNRVVPRFARRFRVVAFDLPGFGEADRPDAAYDGEFFGDQLVALLDALSIQRAHLVGSSLGASAIVHCSNRHADRIDHAVLAAPGGFGRWLLPLMRLPALPLVGPWIGRPTSLGNRMTLRLALHDRRHLTNDLMRRTNQHARIDGSDRSFVRTLRAGVGVFGTRQRAATERLARAFARPVLLVWGRQDRVFAPTYARHAADLLPDARLTLIDQCGHWPHWERPDEFAVAVERFLP